MTFPYVLSCNSSSRTALRAAAARLSVGNPNLDRDFRRDQSQSGNTAGHDVNADVVDASDVGLIQSRLLRAWMGLEPAPRRRMCGVRPSNAICSALMLKGRWRATSGEIDRRRRELLVSCMSRRPASGSDISNVLSSGHPSLYR